MLKVHGAFSSIEESKQTLIYAGWVLKRKRNSIPQLKRPDLREEESRGTKTQSER